ncbi:MAG: type II toxin-antitoxin system HicB family antitoxin [Oscillospiraceae bacterium]|nr:type II toxin-antitoxin system HicB family antitoxin [Oscillospiraceae bacterium]
MLTSKARKREHTIATRGGNMVPVYHVVVRPCEDTDGYWAECLMENGGCTTQGETLQETQKNMFESVALYLEDFPAVSNYTLEFDIRNT